VNAGTEPQVVPAQPIDERAFADLFGQGCPRGSSPTFPASRQPRRRISSSKRAFESSRKPSGHSPATVSPAAVNVGSNDGKRRSVGGGTRLRQVAGVLAQLRVASLYLSDETHYSPGIGREFMHHVHADDVAQAFEAAVVRRDAAAGEDFNIVVPSALNVRGYAQIAAESRRPSIADGATRTQS
jgi:hypothetical protein